MFFLRSSTYRLIVSVMLLIMVPFINFAKNIVPIPICNNIFVSKYDTVANIKSNFTDTLNIDSTDAANSNGSIQAKIRDSVLTLKDSLTVIYFMGDIENRKLNNYDYIDTNTYNFQRYNPLHLNNGLYSTLSNIGLAAKNLVYTPTLSPSYFMGSSVFSNFLYHNSDVRYYSPYVPYTELNYVMGANHEQNFNVVFARKISRGITFGLDYALNFSPTNSSPYLRSGVNDQRIYITTQYYTKNMRYGLIANYLRNKVVAEENGGLKYDSIFEDNIESDRRIIPVNLMNAQNMVKQSGFFIQQYFNILSPISNKDSIKRKIDAGNISYSFRYRRNQMIYTDADSLTSFYIGNSTPLNTVSTYDSLFQEEFQNTFRWSSIGYQKNKKEQIFYMYMGATHSYIKQTLPYDSISATYSQITTFGGVEFNFGESFHLNADTRWVFSGYNQGDFRIKGTLIQYLGNKEKNIGFFNFGVDFSNRTPNWYYNKYQSNYYRWSNSLKKERQLLLSGSYNFHQLSFEAKFYTFGNYTYLDDSIRPQQIDRGETVLQLTANGTIPLHKFGINLRTVYQTTSQPSIIRLPKLSGVMDIYFRSFIFKKAAVLQTGFQFTYFSEFYADAYMPELRLFYLQNDKKIGNYPYADFYVTLMVKQVRLFLRMAHFNGYFGNYRYYLAPNYPAQDARFYFGASWRFHN